jgi:hypothetical protein
MLLIAYLASVISLEGIIARLYYPPAVFNFSHEKAFLIIFSVAVGFIYKKNFLIFISLIFLVFNFLTYPALTYVLCAIVAIVIHRMLKKQNNILKYFILQSASIYFLYYSTIRISKGTGFLDSIYKSLNRDNNVGYREFLIKTVEHQIIQSPYFGSLFRRSVLVETPGANLPVHNDFVTVTLGGGIFCLLLYIGIYFGTNYNIFKFFRIDHDMEIKKALLCFAILVNGYFFCSGANPISMKAQNGMILTTSIYAIKYLTSNSIRNRVSNP